MALIQNRAEVLGDVSEQLYCFLTAIAVWLCMLICVCHTQSSLLRGCWSRQWRSLEEIHAIELFLYVQIVALIVDSAFAVLLSVFAQDWNLVKA